ncbi:MAG: VWA domain-containing protein [Dehalococcoidia bacterium]
MTPGPFAVDFAQPLALVALLAVEPARYAMGLAARHDRVIATAYGGPADLRTGPGARRRRVRDALLIGVIALTAVAIARPRWGAADVPLERRGIDVAIALDISRSMSAADVAPTRSAAAADGLSALLQHLPEDRVGLVTFAGSALARAPLTTDLDAIRQLIARAQGEAPLVQPGSDLGAAIETALALLDIDEPAGTQVIVLVSDGERVDPSAGAAALDAALAHARERGVRVYAVIAGTAAGGRLTDHAATAGEISRADAGVLERIASESGGEATTVEAVAGLAVEFRRMSQSLFAQETQIALVERFQWFVGGALVLLLAHGALGATRGRGRRRAWRRRQATAPALAVLALVLVGCSGTALYRAITRGNAAYDEQRYDAALASYQEASTLAPEDPAVLYDLGNALHQLRRYEEAAVSTEAGIRVVEDPALAFLLQYSAGAHAFRRGVLDEAREAYISALRLQPDDTDARENLELVLLALNPPPPPPPPDAGQSEDDPGPPADPGAGQPPPAPAAPPEDGGQDAGASGGGSAAAATPPGATDPAGAGGAGGGTIEPETEASALEAAQAELAEALAALGPELTLEEALRVLELARRANALQELPSRGGRAPER